jgi:hypothetical protein
VYCSLEGYQTEFLTVVLTTIWCELVADPKLFYRGRVSSRDRKLIGAVFIFLGGFTGRALVDQIGPSGALGVGTGIRVVIGLSWIFIPGKREVLDM